MTHHLQETLDFLNKIEGDGYGGMAAFEIARQAVRHEVERPMTDIEQARETAVSRIKFAIFDRDENGAVSWADDRIFNHRAIAEYVIRGMSKHMQETAFIETVAVYRTERVQTLTSALDSANARIKTLEQAGKNLKDTIVFHGLARGTSQHARGIRFLAEKLLETAALEFLSTGGTDA